MAAANADFDIAGPLDHGRWNGLRQAVVLMVALAIVFDGVNNQLLGLAAPAIASEFHIAKAAFAQVVAAGVAGMAIGALFGGMFGDRIGRRSSSLMSIAVFGAATAAMAAERDLPGLMALRFAVGLGLGALLPNALALIAEFSPLNVRSAIVMAVGSCTPVGGILAAMVAAAQMQLAGWRALFFIAGAATVALAAILAVLLPESPRYLVQNRRFQSRLAALLARLGVEVPEGSVLVDGHQPHAPPDVAALFSPAFRRDTIGLCVAFFLAYIASFSFLSWLPSALSELGLSYRMQGVATAIFNLGGIVGILAGSVAVNRVGSRLPMLVLSAASVIASLLLMGAKPIVNFSPWALTLGLALLASALGVVETALYALAVHIFPPQIRTTGAGFAGAIGRVGALVSSFTAAFALEWGGVKVFFLSIAGVMFICGASLFVIKQHSVAGREAVSDRI